MKTDTKKERTRRTPEEIVADLQSEIDRVRARAAAKEARQLPEVSAAPPELGADARGRRGRERRPPQGSLAMLRREIDEVINWLDVAQREAFIRARSEAAR